MLIHATCVARQGAGVLLRGPSGSGKSALALRLLHAGFDLVSDDAVELVGRVACSTVRLRGLIEVRGLGLYKVDHLESVELKLVVTHGTAERLPERSLCDITGLPTIRLDFASVHAVAVINLAVDVVLGRVVEVAGPIIT